MLVALALLVALVVAGRWAARPAAAPPPLAPVVATGARAAPQRELVVHVVGAVRRPGLYRLREGSRVADAVRRAGGATRKADTSLVNLAAPLVDGSQIVVPRRGSAAAAAAGGASGPVSLSSATLEQLDALPGLGPTTAQRIIDYREQHGPFRSVDELDAVPGFGPARVEQLRELVVP